MAVTKTISATGSHGYHKFTLTVTETAVDTVNNKSTCSVKLTLSPVKSGYNWYDYTGSQQPKGSVVFNGNTYSWTLSNYDGTSTVTLVSKSVSVSHDTDGSKTVSFSFSAESGSTYYLPGSASGSGTLALTKIARYPTSVQKLSSKTETTIAIAWSSDSTIDVIKYSTNNGSTWIDKNVTDGKSGTYTISGLSANTSYTVITQVRSKDSQLWTKSSALSVKTYNWPYATIANFNVKDGGSVKLTNPLSRSVSVKLYAQNTLIATVTKDKTIPASWADRLLDKIPNSMTGTLKAEVTYSSHTMIATGTYSATGYNPTVSSATYEDVESTVQAIVQDTSKILQNKSTPRFSVSGTAQYGASISLAKVVILTAETALTKDGTYFRGTTGVINSASNVTAKVTITDSRGNSASKNVTVKMVAYSIPSAIVKVERQNNYYSETDVEVDPSITYIGSNEATVMLRYKRTDATAWTPWEAIKSRTKVTIELDNHYAWNVQVKVTDTIGGSKTYKLSVSIGMPIIFFDRYLRSVSVNCFPDSEEQFAVNNVDWSMTEAEYNELKGLLT